MVLGWEDEVWDTIVTTPAVCAGCPGSSVRFSDVEGVYPGRRPVDGTVGDALHLDLGLNSIEGSCVVLLLLSVTVVLTPPGRARLVWVFF